jgi:hypothetical protein
MNIREVLQTEVWSKETSRKILLGLGIVVGLYVVGFKGWQQVELRWLTSGERNAARVALQQIDALQDSASLSDEDFSVKSKQASKGMDAAQQAARTTRDKLVVAKLMDYQLGIVVRRLKVRKQKQSQQRMTSLTDSDRKLNGLIESSRIDVNGNDGLALHKELD